MQQMLEQNVKVTRTFLGSDKQNYAFDTIKSNQDKLIKLMQLNSSKKVLQFKFDLLYITLFSVFSTKIGIIRKLV